MKLDDGSLFLFVLLVQVKDCVSVVVFVNYGNG